MVASRFYIFAASLIFLVNVKAFAMDTYSKAPTKIDGWRISCSVDKGSITGKDNNWIFRTSKNKCKGGTFQQRSEINTKKAISPRLKAKYNFQSIFSMQGGKYEFEQFDIFQIHDGRDGCAPPLKVTVQGDGKLVLRSDYQTGSGEKCERDIMQSSGQSKNWIDRDGTEYKLNVVLYFDGKSGFDVQVFLNENLEVSGKYTPPKGKGYTQSKYFYFKHGVYSRNMFKYELKSTISMNLVQ